MARPNVLVIQTDQWRWDCLGAYGNRQIQTPHLDVLAASGVRFDHCFCPLPVCTPSRYSLLSGLYVHQHAGWTNRSTLAPGIATFPKLLRAAGYRTKAVGKMHLTPTYLDVGFDEMELAEQDGDGRLDDDYHRDLRAHGLIDAIDLIDQRREFRRRAPDEYWAAFGALRSDLPEEWHSTTWIGDRAVRTLEAWSGEANLLLVSFIKPHHPFDPPAPWDALYSPDALELLPGWMEAVPEHDRAYAPGYFDNTKLTPAALRRVMAYYYATISQIDHHVGRLLAVLRRRGLYDRTLIVFTADHGEYLGYHHMLLKSGHLYEPLARVPLLLKLPGGELAGTSCDALVSTVDIAPTILRAGGLEPPAPLPGLDLASLARSAEDGRPFVFAENRRGGSYMVRSRTHKLLLTRQPGQSLFFDLRDDPYELRNRIDDPACAALVETHRDALARWMLFETPVPAYSDPEAPCIRQPNVPAAGDGHREQMMAYFEERVAAYLQAYLHGHAAGS